MDAIINTHAHRLLMGWASQRRPHRHPSYLSQASCLIVSGFTAALDLDTYPLSNFIRPWCAEQANVLYNYYLTPTHYIRV